MKTIKQIREKVDKTRKGLDAETERIILKFEQEILDLVREKQLFDLGIDGLGQSLTPPYTDNTIAFKFQKGQRSDHVTLKDTGDFYRSFNTDYGNFEMEIFATDSKTADLETKYGDNIFLITTKNQEVLSEKIIRPNLVKYFNGIFK